MDDARTQFLIHAEASREYLNHGFSEADTRAYLVDPVLRMLGYVRPGDLRREVPIPATKEFLDYELYADGKAQAIVEAKAVRHSISDQAAAQCVQYASILGVRWCIITNGLVWAVYNAHATGPLAQKKVAVVSVADTEEANLHRVWDVLSLFSRASLGQQAPLSRLLAERVIMDELERPDSAAVGALRKSVRDRFGERVSGDLIVEILRQGMSNRETVSEVAAVAPSAPTLSEPPLLRAKKMPAVASQDNPNSTRIQLRNLVEAGLIPTDAAVEMKWMGVTYAARIRDGAMEMNGQLYPSPSAAASAVRLGKASNGWRLWAYQGKLLADIRSLLPESTELTSAEFGD